MRHVENLIMIQKVYIFIIKNNQPFSNYLQKDEDCYLTFHIPKNASFIEVVQILCIKNHY